MMAFGLKNKVAFYRAHLADSAVHRAQHSRIGQWPGVWFESSREKRIEAVVLADVRLCRMMAAAEITLALVHVPLMSCDARLVVRATLAREISCKFVCGSVATIDGDAVSVASSPSFGVRL